MLAGKGEATGCQAGTGDLPDAAQIHGISRLACVSWPPSRGQALSPAGRTVSVSASLLTAMEILSMASIAVTVVFAVLVRLFFRREKSLREP